MQSRYNVQVSFTVDGQVDPRSVDVFVFAGSVEEDDATLIPPFVCHLDVSQFNRRALDEFHATLERGVDVRWIAVELDEDRNLRGHISVIFSSAAQFSAEPHHVETGGFA